MQLTTEQAVSSFAYRAQTEDGLPLSGTIDSTNADDARRQLSMLRLRIIDIAPSEKPTRTRPLSGEDFAAFNQQLGHLTAAGLPMEHGLRLIAEDMRRGRLADTIRVIASELEAGRSLPEVFEKHRGRFPSMYGRLLEAGVRSNNLSAMLFNLARHLELIGRLRAMLWRSFSYPLMVFGALALVMFFLSGWVLPQFEVVFRDFKVTLPAITRFVLWTSGWLPAAMAIVLGIIVAFPLIMLLARRSGLEGKLTDWLVLPMPLAGPVVRKGLIAGWCDALRMGVEAGLDLPAAIALASGASSSPRLRDDGRALVDRLSTGQTLEDATAGGVLPATVLAGIALGVQSHDLPGTLKSLSEMYRQQAEMRLQALPALLTPFLLIIMALAIGLMILALMMPMVGLIRAVSGGGY